MRRALLVVQGLAGMETFANLRSIAWPPSALSAAHERVRAALLSTPGAVTLDALVLLHLSRRRRVVVRYVGRRQLGSGGQVGDVAHNECIADE